MHRVNDPVIVRAPGTPPPPTFPPVLNLKGEDKDGPYQIRPTGSPTTHAVKPKWRWDHPPELDS